LVDQVTRQRPYRVGAQPPPVHRRIEEDVDARVLVVRVLLLAELDLPHDAALVLDRVQVVVLVLQVVSDRGGQVVTAAPTGGHLRRGPNLGQRGHVVVGGRPQRDEGTADGAGEGGHVDGAYPTPWLAR